jgi:uncharacterized protein (TIGR03000 family)
VSPTGRVQAQPDAAAAIEVRVPERAEVWFDGTKTVQSGKLREYASPPLEPGREFTYVVRARWKDGDRDVDETRVVAVSAGSRTSVNFTPDRPAASPPKPGL